MNSLHQLVIRAYRDWFGKARTIFQHFYQVCKKSWALFRENKLSTMLGRSPIILIRTSSTSSFKIVLRTKKNFWRKVLILQMNVSLTYVHSQKCIRRLIMS